MAFLFSIFKSKLARQIGAAVVAFMALVTFGMLKKREGRKEENARQERADNENANDIRDRVRNAKRMPNNDIEYRD